MERLWKIYHEEVPDFIRAMAETPAMERLRDVGMHCGCDYTNFANHRSLIPYHRQVHSVGVALIVWHFTRDEASSAAGLLHDIATPPFAHTVDFLKGDHLRQEATEEGTAAAIAACAPLMKALADRGLTLDQVADYHRYPIADNDSPRLSADRLEYTLGSGLSYGFAHLDELASMYRDLTVGSNEEGQPELAFAHAEPALRFAELSMRNSRVFVSDEDRYAMQHLAEILREALERGVLQREDLCKTESWVIAKLTADPAMNERWTRFTRMSALERRAVRPDGGDWICVNAKRRYIDPLIFGQGRVSQVFPSHRKAIDELLAQDFGVWLRGYED